MEPLEQSLSEAKRAIEKAMMRLKNDTALVEGALSQIDRSLREYYRAQAGGRRIP